MFRFRNVRQFICKFNVVVSAILVCSLYAQPVLSQDSPPVGIGGFHYQYHSENHVHMNVCQAEECVPGSKVSYILYPPEKDPDFDEYKQSQKQVLSLLKNRAPKDMAIIMSEPEMSQDEIFTIFSSFREARSADGRQLFTKSSVIYTDYATISLISSSEDKEAVEVNSAGFTVGLITLSQAQLRGGE